MAAQADLLNEELAKRSGGKLPTPSLSYLGSLYEIPKLVAFLKDLNSGKSFGTNSCGHHLPRIFPDLHLGHCGEFFISWVCRADWNPSPLLGKPSSRRGFVERMAPDIRRNVAGLAQPARHSSSDPGNRYFSQGSKFPEMNPKRIKPSLDQGKRYVIIGNSAAGIAAAKEIRRYDLRGQITIISDEPSFGYSRVLLPLYIAGKIRKRRCSSLRKIFILL